MNQNYKILAVALAIFFISMSFWMLMLGNNDEPNPLNLEETSEYYQNSLFFIVPETEEHVK